MNIENVNRIKKLRELIKIFTCELNYLEDIEQIKKNNETKEEIIENMNNLIQQILKTGE